jgi:hypothetical protein
MEYTCRDMAKKRTRQELLQGTLDMLVLRTLLLGPAHGHTIAHVIERSSDEVLQIEHGSLIPRSTGSRARVSSPRSGAPRKTTARPSTTG